MLDSIRSGASSIGIKIAFGVIILVFVFWGIGNFNDRDYSNVVAVVNGQPILALEFEKAYHENEEYLLRNNPGLTREQLARDHLGTAVLRELIQATLIAQEAKRAGITVSPREMRLAVGKIKIFQDDKGNFDPEAYKRFLAARRTTPAQYEKELADQILHDKMVSIVTAPAWTDPDEPLKRFNFLRERRVIEYAFFDSEPFKARVEIPATEVKEWYDSHQDDFATPPMVAVEYIEVLPQELVERKEIPEKDALAWYESNLAKFEHPERIHARHILVPLAPDADEGEVKKAQDKIAQARDEVAGGKTFAEVADGINGPQAAGKGGDLGWIVKGETVPEFEAAAFALEPGKVSSTVRTPFGLHLILVEEKQESGVTPFAEVANQAYDALAFEAGSAKLHDVLDNLIEDNILQKPLEEAADRYGLKAQRSELMDKTALVQKLNIRPEDAEALLATPAGSPLDTALDADNRYVVARIDSVQPAGTKPFASVEKEIRDRLISRKALELAMAEAETTLQKVRDKAPDAAEIRKLELKTSQPLERGGNLPGFAPDPDFIKAVFGANVHTWLPAPLAVTRSEGQTGAIIAYIDKLEPPAPGEYEAVAGLLTSAGKQERAEGLFDAFIRNLYQNAKVERVNQEMIERLTM